MDLVLLWSIEDFDGMRRREDFLLHRLVFLLVDDVVVLFDEGGAHIVDGFIQLNEFQLLFFTLFYFTAVFIQFFDEFAVAFHEQLVTRLQLFANTLQ